MEDKNNKCRAAFGCNGLQRNSNVGRAKLHGACGGGRGVLTMPEAAAPPSGPLRADAVGTIPVKDRDDDMSLDQLIGIR